MHCLIFLLFFSNGNAEVLSPRDNGTLVTPGTVLVLQPTVNLPNLVQAGVGQLQCQVNPASRKLLSTLNENIEIPIRKTESGGTFTCRRDWVCAVGYQTKPPARGTPSHQFLTECANANGIVGATCESLEVSEVPFFWAAQTTTEIDFNEGDFNKLAFAIYVKYIKLMGSEDKNIQSTYNKKTDYWAALDPQSKAMALLLKDLAEDKCAKPEPKVEKELEKQCEDLASHDYPRKTEIQVGCYTKPQ